MRVVNIRKDKSYTVYIGRGRGGALGNPFSHLHPSECKALVHVDTVQGAVWCFEQWARGSTRWDGAVPPAQRTKLLTALDKLHEDDVLGCFCNADSPCHGQVLVKLWEERRDGKVQNNVEEHGIRIARRVGSRS